MKQKSSLKDRLVGSRYFSFGITLSLFVLLYVVGMMNYRGFMKPQVFCNLLIDNAALIIATIGITFVLLIGGIDISIGSVVALTCMSSAQMLQNTGLPAPAVILIVLAMGAVFGLVQGWLITEFNMQPFIVTLAGQFFARGMTAIISRETIVIDNPVYTSLASARIYVLPGGFISVGVVIALVTLVAATLVLKFTRFGRNIYALGGNEMSAQLMGLPTKRTKILAYVVCGFCSALAGVVYSLIMLSGYPLHAVSMEMDAIASSVIGGTLMSGGVAFLPGTLLGVLIQGVIQTFITFQGTLSAWWTRIIIALLLCLFIVIQAVVSRSRQRLNSEHCFFPIFFSSFFRHSHQARPGGCVHFRRFRHGRFTHQNRRAAADRGAGIPSQETGRLSAGRCPSAVQDHRQPDAAGGSPLQLQRVQAGSVPAGGSRRGSSRQCPAAGCLRPGDPEAAGARPGALPAQRPQLQYRHLCPALCAELSAAGHAAGRLHV